ncbi:MAG: CDP-alcohol phosphatidyltransferase family protein [Planctomycetia bacterium]|jgi:phosphatidylglycerophosphate synthase
MAEYSPESRRPIADIFRTTATMTVRLCVRLEIHPDVISYASILAAAGAGACFWWAQELPLLLLLAPILCLVRLWLNMLDGMVALASGKASRRGEILNDLPDRVSDVLIFVGVGYSGLAHVALGYWAAILALLTAYVGTLGQAVGARREFGGLMSKPWRMVIVMIGAVLAYFLFQREIPLPAGLTILDVACIIVIAGCLQTIFVRLRRICRHLNEQD